MVSEKKENVYVLVPHLQSISADCRIYTLSSAARYQLIVSGLTEADSCSGSNAGASTSEPTSPFANGGGEAFFTGEDFMPDFVKALQT